MTDRRREILQAALDIADSDGADAVSMRSVARRVGVTPMALYSYVDSKGALLDGLVELLLAELPKPDPAAVWHERLRVLARGLRAVARRHPAVFSLLLLRPAVTADAVAVTDQLFDALLDAGVPPGDVTRVERLVSTFAIGYAMSEIGGRFGTGPRSGYHPPLDTTDLPGHRRLAGHLDDAVDWDAEHDRDLDDMLALVETVIVPAHR